MAEEKEGVKQEVECQYCIHYTPYAKGDGALAYAECRRFPPTSQRVPYSNSTKSSFPAMYEVVHNFSRVDPWDWCGEFREGKI